jgi:hypothetical protein
MKKILFFWKTIAWTAFMLVLFLIPSQDIPGTREIPHLDKAVHMVFFMTFTILFMRDMLKMKELKYIFPSYIFITFLVVLSFTIMVELLQDKMKLGRDGDIIDILYGLVGFLLGVFLLILKYRIRVRNL